jgi:hypothetical protein
MRILSVDISAAAAAADYIVSLLGGAIAAPFVRSRNNLFLLQRKTIYDQG